MHTPKGNPQLKLQPMDLILLLQGQQLTRSLISVQRIEIPWSSHQRQELHVWGQQISCHQLYHPQLHHLQKTPLGILSSSQGSNCSQIHLIPLERWQKATLLTSSANIGSLQLCGPCSSLSCSGGVRLPPS